MVEFGNNRKQAVTLLIVIAFISIGVFAWKMRRIDNRPQTKTAAEITSSTPSIADTKKIPPGRWRKFRGEANRDRLTDEEQKALAKLQTIGYTSGSRPPQSQKTITVYDPDKAYPGLNLFTSGHFPGAILMDMEGNILHTWERSCEQIWPELDPDLMEISPDFWRAAHVFVNGDVLGIFAGIGVFKLDAGSNVIWSNQNGAHHDFEILPNGDIYVLTRTAHLIHRLNKEDPILEDFLVVLDSNGKEKIRISLIKCFENYGEYYPSDIEWKGDVFHTNKVHVLDGSIAHRSPDFRSGNILTSIRNINAIAIVDMDKQAIVKAWNGENEGFKAQHDPTIVENGNLLFFNNLGGPEGKSRVMEVDPVTFEIKWLYDGTESDPLFSPTMSTVECLPNGNILITESDNGRALEITRDKEIVWEFYNPHRIHPVEEYIATVPEVVRLPLSFPTDWIDSGTQD
jgi:hypothetical protein